MKKLVITAVLVAISTTRVNAIVVEPGYIINQSNDWTGEPFPGTNWSFTYVQDTDGNPSDGWKQPGSNLTYDPSFFGNPQDAFETHDDGSPAVLQTGLLVNSLVPPGFNVGVPQWWGIASWTSEQDSLHLQVSDYMIAYDGFVEDPDRLQVVFALTKGGGYAALMDKTLDPKVNGTSFIFPVVDFSSTVFTLNTGDSFLLAMRYVDTPTVFPEPRNYLSLNTETLFLHVIPEPSTFALAAFGLVCVAARARRRN